MNRSPDDWLAFVGKARALRSIKVDKWLAKHNRVTHVHRQLQDEDGLVHSNAAAEAELRWIRGQWAGRAASYRNAYRTNNLLKLMALHRRGADNARDWALIIRKALAGNDGHAAITVRSACDTAGVKPSLRV